MDLRVELKIWLHQPMHIYTPRNNRAKCHWCNLKFKWGP